MNFERNVLFNDALNTFHLWLYGVRHTLMVNDHSDSERVNPVSLPGIIPQTGDDIPAFVAPVMEHWLE